MNGEQTGFVKFVNQIQMTAFSALISQVVWLVGSLTLTWVDYRLFTGPEENHRSYGLQLAIALLAAWTGKSITNAASGYGVRTTAREYVEAKERGKASATPPAATVHAEKVEKVEVQPERPRA
jgi:uncharacterized metal-binding protein